MADMQGRTTRRFVVAAAALAFTAGLGFGAAPAPAKTIKLTLAAGQPPRLKSLGFARDYFIPEVQKRIDAAGLDVKIEWTQAYAGSLCKPTKCLFAAQDGVTDVAFVPTIFHPDKLPLENVGFMAPFLSNDVNGICGILDRLHESIPAMRAQYDRYNQIRLGGQGIDSFELVSTFPVKSVDDVKGRKIGTAGGALSWLRGTGAVPVQSNMMEYYNSTKTGVYDAFIVFPTAFLPFKYTEVAPNVSLFDFGAQCASVLTMNKQSFAKLPAPVQKIFLDTAKDYGRASDNFYQTAHQKSLKVVSGMPGVNIIRISREEKKRWADAMPNIAAEWAAEMERKGLPGRKVLKAYMDEMRKAGIDPVRDWDTE